MAIIGIRRLTWVVDSAEDMVAGRLAMRFGGRELASVAEKGSSVRAASL